MRKTCLIALLGLASVSAQQTFSENVFAPGPDADKMGQLPNCTLTGISAYSGYLKVTDTKQLHYVFIGSKDKSTDPVVLWFNGGPGCSSLEGLFQEHGPCVITDGETQIRPNPFSWNQRAHVVYIESPAGVGYSIAENPEDNIQNDYTQSQDTFTALMAFYEKFPTLKTNDLYISGESYAGIYVPYLSWQVYQYNQAQKMKGLPQINQKGFMVGNGVTDFNIDVWSAYIPTLYNFQMIPKSLYETYVNNSCFFSFRGVLKEQNSKICTDTFKEIRNMTDRWVNWYDLYRPLPPHSQLQAENRMGEVFIEGERRTYKRGKTVSEYTPWINDADHIIYGMTLTDYINDPQTRKAMNIPNSLPAFELCSSTLEYYCEPEASKWIYKVLRGKIRMLFYSGDTDGALPTVGTKRWIETLNWPRVEDTRQWYLKDQVAGYLEQYDGLDFATVHGTGHMSPEWKPEQVTQMIMAWIHNEDI